MKVASLLVLPGGFDRKMLVSGDVAEKLLRMGLVEEIQSGVGGRQYAVASPLAEMPPHEQWTQLEKAWPSDDVRHKRMMKMAEAHKDRGLGVRIAGCRNQQWSGGSEAVLMNKGCTVKRL